MFSFLHSSLWIWLKDLFLSSLTFWQSSSIYLPFNKVANQPHLAIRHLKHGKCKCCKSKIHPQFWEFDEEKNANIWLVIFYIGNMLKLSYVWYVGLNKMLLKLIILFLFYFLMWLLQNFKLCGIHIAFLLNSVILGFSRQECPLNFIFFQKSFPW